jgi:uncharacterized delta-60 repeat protein
MGHARVGVLVAMVWGLSLTLAIAVLPASSAPTDGSPDTTFSQDLGSGFANAVLSVASQADGKVVAGGIFTSVNGTASNYVARLNPDGTVDTNFSLSLGGDSGGFNGAVEIVVVQPDGKILVGGQFTSVNGTPSNRLARLNRDGTVDAAFSDALGGAGGGFNATVRSIAVRRDASIFVAGDFTQVSSTASSHLVLLEPSGVVDEAFTGGLDGGFNNNVSSVALDADEHVLAAGDFTKVGSKESNRLARLNADGTTDGAFSDKLGGAGGGFNKVVETVVVQPNGQIVTGGEFTSPSRRLARVNADGTFDAAFTAALGGQDGGFDDDVATALAQPNGQILVGGAFEKLNNAPARHFVRLNADGHLDVPFLANLGSNFDDPPNQVVLQEGGGIIAGGLFESVNGIPSFFAARLQDAAYATSSSAPGPGLIPGTGVDGSKLLSWSAFALAVTVFGAAMVRSFRRRAVR